MPEPELIQVQKLSPKAVKIAEGLMGKLTEVEQEYMKDLMLGLTAAQSADIRGVKTHTVYVQRSTLRRKLEILMARGEIYIRLPKPAAPRWVKTSALAKRMGVSIDTLQWWVKREEKREGGPSLPLPAKINARYRWTVTQAEVWIRYAESQKAAYSTADVAALLGDAWPVSRLHAILEKRRELYGRYNEWHSHEVVRLIDALECAGSLTPDEAQAAKAKLEQRKNGKE